MPKRKAKKRPRGLIKKLTPELGEGFAFIARQKRIVIDGRDFRIDLLFYHRGLRRLIVIDHKIGAGLGAIVDTPLSLAGDIATFPIAYARSKEYPWATWRGEKSLDIRPTLVPAPEPTNKRVDDRKKASRE